MKKYFYLFALNLTFLAQGQSLILDPSFGTNGTSSNGDPIKPSNGYF